jgi:hypothetical protein
MSVEENRKELAKKNVIIKVSKLYAYQDTISKLQAENEALRKERDEWQRVAYELSQDAEVALGEACLDEDKIKALEAELAELKARRCDNCIYGDEDFGDCTTYEHCQYLEADQCCSLWEGKNV